MSHEQPKSQDHTESVATSVMQRGDPNTVSAPSVLGSQDSGTTRRFLLSPIAVINGESLGIPLFELRNTTTGFSCFAAPSVMRSTPDPESGEVHIQRSIRLRESLSHPGCSEELRARTKEINDRIWDAANWKGDGSLQGLSDEAAIKLVWSKAHEGVQSLAQKGEWSFEIKSIPLPRGTGPSSSNPPASGDDDDTVKSDSHEHGSLIQARPPGYRFWDSTSIPSKCHYVFRHIGTGPYSSEFPASCDDYTVKSDTHEHRSLIPARLPGCTLVDPSTSARYIIYPQIHFASLKTIGETGTDAHSTPKRIGFLPTIVMQRKGSSKAFSLGTALPAISATVHTSQKNTNIGRAIWDPVAAPSTAATSQPTPDIAANPNVDAPQDTTSSSAKYEHDRGMRLVDSMMSFDNVWWGQGERLGQLLEQGDIPGAIAHLHKTFEDTLRSLKTAPESVYGSGWFQFPGLFDPSLRSRDPTVMSSKRPPQADDGTTPDQSTGRPTIKLESISDEILENTGLRRSKRLRGKNASSM